MMRHFFQIISALAFVLISWSGAFSDAPKKTTIREFQSVRKTYPFSEPNPIPTMTAYYPYFRFDGFAITSIEKEWKVVELANELISLEIFPEIGGKIWTATDKKTGKSFFYSNSTMKFRDVGMRGPWTSGGLEMNAGIIGHAPSCSTPVDYAVRSNPDGSASCFIGCLDLVTRSEWTVEIRLPADSAAFSTRVIWNNGTDLTQPYYTWMNLGIRATEDLRLINPGTAFLGHDGLRHDWPIDEKSGRDLSYYKNDLEGSYKSYHIIGKMAEYFGAYYENEDFGIVSFIPSEGKRGRKIWIWGHSREGMIWEDILADPPSGQYVEIQTGRLFNQAAASSGKTPFKQRGFAPYSTESWIEYWMPVRGIGGFNVADSSGALNVTRNGNRIDVAIFAASAIQGEMVVSDSDGKRLNLPGSVPIAIPAGETFTRSISLPDDFKTDSAVTVSVTGHPRLTWSDNGEDILTRPLASENAKRTDRLSDIWEEAKEDIRDRDYVKAEGEFLKCLELDSGFLPAMTGLAENAVRRGDDEKAIEWARKALEIDAYDGPANHLFGLASFHLGRWADAREAFSVATMDVSVRSAAFIGLGKTRLALGETAEALDAFENGLNYNAKSPEARFGKLCALYQMDRVAHNVLAREILAENPLCHVARFELYFSGKLSSTDVINAITCELPHETILETAIRYAELRDWEKAEGVLKLGLTIPNVKRTEILYHLAYYLRDLSILAEAEKAPVEFCFPFRTESLPVFRWAKEKGHSWRNAYYLAVLNTALHRTEEANALLADLGETPDSPIFYAFRAATIPQNRAADYEKMIALDDSRPIYAILYLSSLEQAKNPEKFLAAAKKYGAQFPENRPIILAYAEALSQNGRYDEAIEFLERTTLLPDEGLTSARKLYHDNVLQVLAKALTEDDFEKSLMFTAKARLWPENLGSGKPFDADCDERLEDWVEYSCLRASEGGDEKVIQQATLLDRIIAKSGGEKALEPPFARLLYALALREKGDNEAGERLFHEADRASLNYYRGELTDADLAEFDKTPVGRVLIALLKGGAHNHF